MTWGLEFDRSADEDLDDLDASIKNKILKKVEWLAENFEGLTPRPLKGEFSDFYKLRVGDWRVIYEIDWDRKIIFIVYIKHRDSVYK